MYNSEPRQHHIVPSSYLAGFTTSGTNVGKLHVYDFVEKRHYRTSAKKACRERDYYRIYEPGEDQNLVENLMAQVESGAAQVLQEVKRNNRANATQVGVLLDLGALITARNRRGRFTLSQFLTTSLKMHLASGEIPKEKWNKIREAEIRAGANPEALPKYEEAKQLAAKGEFFPPAPQPLQVGLILEIAHEIALTLRKKRWELHKWDSRKGGFIASDAPLFWGALEELAQGYSTAGLADTKVEITFPINSSMALVSYPSAREGNFETTESIVARTNTRTLLFSTGQVFYPNEEFTLWDKGRIFSSKEYFEFVKGENNINDSKGKKL